MIIGLAGAKTAGKNTVADFITEIFGSDFEVNHWSFAEDLKKSAAEALGVRSEYGVAFCDRLKEYSTIEIHLGFDIEDEDSGYIGDKLTLSGREYLQWYGTEAHRNIFGDDFWVNNLLDKIFRRITPTSTEERLDIITDVRFPNEAEAIREAYGLIVRVSRPEVENSGDTHASELPLHESLIDDTINNESTLSTLRTNTYIVIGRLIDQYLES